MKNSKFTPTPKYAYTESAIQKHKSKFLVWGFILWGIIAAAGALFAELAINSLSPEKNFVSDNFFDSLTLPLILFAAVEEMFKFLVIYKSIGKIDSWRETFQKSLFIGLGFSLAEICLIYLMNAQNQGSRFVALLGILIVHISTSLLLGYFSLKLMTGRKSILLIAFLCATILHLIYNTLVIYNIGPWTFLVYLFVLLLLPLLAFYRLSQKENLQNTKY